MFSQSSILNSRQINIKFCSIVHQSVRSKPIILLSYITAHHRRTCV
jgi:hypothetical protein